MINSNLALSRLATIARNGH